MSGLIWIQTVWHFDGIPERIFQKVDFEKNQQTTKKHAKLPSRQRVGLLEPFADNLCKQFGFRSGPTKCRAWSGSKLFDTLMVLLKEFFEKVEFEKNQQTTKKHAKLPSRQRVGLLEPSADNLCKQLGFRSGPTKCRTWSGSKLFDTLMVLLNFLKKLILKIISRRQNYPVGKELFKTATKATVTAACIAAILQCLLLFLRTVRVTACWRGLGCWGSFSC